MGFNEAATLEEWTRRCNQDFGVYFSMETPSKRVAQRMASEEGVDIYTSQSDGRIQGSGDTTL